MVVSGFNDILILNKDGRWCLHSWHSDKLVMDCVAVSVGLVPPINVSIITLFICSYSQAYLPKVKSLLDRSELHYYIHFLKIFVGCHWWPLWCGLSFGRPRWNYALQRDEEAIWQLYLHSSQKWHLQVLLQQWILHVHSQNSLLWLPGRWRPSTLSQWEQSHCPHPGKLCVVGMLCYCLCRTVTALFRQLPKFHKHFSWQSKAECFCIHILLCQTHFYF